MGEETVKIVLHLERVSLMEQISFAYSPHYLLMLFQSKYFSILFHCLQEFDFDLIVWLTEFDKDSVSLDPVFEIFDVQLADLLP